MFGTRKLGRTSDQRKAMLRAMTTYLLENGKMETTFTRAKEVQPVVEKMITLGKKKGLANYRKALSYITKEDVAHKLFEEIAPKYAERNGGYTRVTRIGPRRGDAAEMCIIELVETKAELEAKAAAAKKAAKKPAAKKPAAKKSAPKAEKKEAETDDTAEAKE